MGEHHEKRIEDEVRVSDDLLHAGPVTIRAGNEIRVSIQPVEEKDVAARLRVSGGGGATVSGTAEVQLVVETPKYGLLLATVGVGGMLGGAVLGNPGVVVGAIAGYIAGERWWRRSDETR